MGTLFISHSSRDRAAAEQLKAALASEGFESVFLDVDPESGIPAGADWERVLYQAVRTCEAVVFLSSPQSLASNWCFGELVVARFLNKGIFPVILAGDERHPLLIREQSVD